MTPQQRAKTPLRCAVTSDVEAGKGVADEEAQGFGSGPVVFAGDGLVARAGDLVPVASRHRRHETTPPPAF